MPEREIIVDHLKFSYEGLFNLSEVYNVIVSFFFEKGYDWREEMNEEQILPEGKQVRLVLKPWKNLSDYFKSQHRIKVNFIDVKDVEIEHNGSVLKMNHGLIRITFDAYIIDDREGWWEHKPVHWVLNFLANKYFYHGPRHSMETWIKSDVADLHERIKNYLNVFKYTYQA